MQKDFMRKNIVCIAIVLLVCSVAAMAANQFGVADKQQVTFYNAVRIGDTLLPAGTYTVLHQMKGAEHIMVFTRPGKQAAEARVKCTLTPLSEAATKTELEYKLVANEHVLSRMVFRGDRAEHRF